MFLVNIKYLANHLNRWRRFTVQSRKFVSIHALTQHKHTYSKELACKSPAYEVFRSFCNYHSHLTNSRYIIWFLMHKPKQRGQTAERPKTNAV